VAYVGKDGTLWVGDNTGSFLKVGKETNWVAVVVNSKCVVALEADGTLWKWNVVPNPAREGVKVSLTRLGIHDDWVCLTSGWGGAISLAADGSLWY
jgi:hypothetical protein